MCREHRSAVFELGNRFQILARDAVVADGRTRHLHAGARDDIDNALVTQVVGERLRIDTRSCERLDQSWRRSGRKLQRAGTPKLCQPGEGAPMVQPREHAIGDEKARSEDKLRFGHRHAAAVADQAAINRDRIFRFCNLKPQLPRRSIIPSERRQILRLGGCTQQQPFRTRQQRKHLFAQRTNQSEAGADEVAGIVSAVARGLASAQQQRENFAIDGIGKSFDLLGADRRRLWLPHSPFLLRWRPTI